MCPTKPPWPRCYWPNCGFKLCYFIVGFSFLGGLDTCLKPLYSSHCVRQNRTGQGIIGLIVVLNCAISRFGKTSFNLVYGKCHVKRISSSVRQQRVALEKRHSRKERPPERRPPLPSSSLVLPYHLEFLTEGESGKYSEDFFCICAVIG